MASINVFTIVGNITRDLELRQTGNGNPTVTYTVAVNNVWYDNTGNKHEDCDFIPVTTYGKQAENDAKYLGKGATVAITGHIRSWYNQAQGKGGFNFEADAVQYLGKPSAVNSGRQNQQSGNDHDDWTREYDRADQAGTQQPHGSSRH